MIFKACLIFFTQKFLFLISISLIYCHQMYSWDFFSYNIIMEGMIINGTCVKAFTTQDELREKLKLSVSESAGALYIDWG